MKKRYWGSLLFILKITMVFASSESNNDTINIKAAAASGEVNVVNNEFSADGGISLEYGDIKITANQIYKVPGQPVVVATGNVTLKQKNFVIQADKVTMNLNTYKAEVLNARSYSDKMFFGGETLTAEFPEKATAKQTYFTTDWQLNDPTYQFKAEKMTVYPNSKLTANNVTLYAGKYPIFWTPYYATTLKNSDGRNTLFPQFGSSTQYGDYVLWGVDYTTIPYKYLTGYADLRYTTKLGWLVNWSDDLNFAKTSKANITVSDLNFPRVNTQMQWNLQTTFHDESPTGEDYSNSFFRNHVWDLYYQNVSTNLLLDPNGAPLNQSSIYTINQKNMWKLQVKGKQQIGEDANLNVDVSQSQQSIVQQLIQPNPGQLLPNTQNVQLWTKLDLTKENSLYKYYLNLDNEANLNPDIVGIKFTHKNNFETYFDQKIYKAKIEYKSINQDELEINPLNPTQNRQVSPQITDEDTKATFGTYPFMSSPFYYGYQVENINDDEFHNKYLADGSYTQYHTIDKHQGVGLTLGNKTIPVGVLGNLDWNSQNDFNYYTNVPDSGSATIVGSPKLSSGELDNKATITTPLYSNLGNDARWYDLKITNELPLEYRFTNGAIPDELEEYNYQNNQYATLKAAGDKVTTELGTLTWVNSFQRLDYYPFKQSWLSEQNSKYFSQAQIMDSKLSFENSNMTQYTIFRTPSKQVTKYSVTYNSNKSEMYQYNYSSENDFNQNPLQGSLATLVASNNILDYNYTNGEYGLDYKNVKTYGVSQSQPTLDTVTNNQLNHFWTGVYDNQSDKSFSKYIKVTYGYGYNYLTQDPGSTSTVVTLGFVDKRDAYPQVNVDGVQDGIQSVDPNKKKSSSLFPSEKAETNELINSNASVQQPFSLASVGETYQQDLADTADITKSKYRSYTLQLSSTRDMSYAYDNPLTPINFVNSFTNYAMSFDMKLQDRFEYNPYINLTRSAMPTGGSVTAPTQDELGQTIKFKLGPTDYAYWLTFMTAYDWAPNPTNAAQRIGWSDLGIGLTKRVRAVDWNLVYERAWNYSTNQRDSVITLAVSINAFPMKGIGYSQNGPNRGFSAGI